MLNTHSKKFNFLLLFFRSFQILKWFGKYDRSKYRVKLIETEDGRLERKRCSIGVRLRKFHFIKIQTFLLKYTDSYASFSCLWTWACSWVRRYHLIWVVNKWGYMKCEKRLLFLFGFKLFRCLDFIYFVELWWILK